MGGVTLNKVDLICLLMINTYTHTYIRCLFLIVLDIPHTSTLQNTRSGKTLEALQSINSDGLPDAIRVCTIWLDQYKSLWNPAQRAQARQTEFQSIEDSRFVVNLLIL